MSLKGGSPLHADPSFRLILYETGLFLDKPSVEGDNRRSSSLSPQAGVTQLVECDLAKVDVAGSNPVSRSKVRSNPQFPSAARFFHKPFVAAFHEKAPLNCDQLRPMAIGYSKLSMMIRPKKPTQILFGGQNASAVPRRSPSVTPVFPLSLKLTATLWKQSGVFIIFQSSV